MKLYEIRPRFGEFIPDQLEEGVLYVSERFRTCSHKCCCGCGEEVVTPLSSAEWSLTREGDIVSLWPSVGNWDYACKSHYIIRRNQVKWATAMSAQKIRRVQERDRIAVEMLTRVSNAQKMSSGPDPSSPLFLGAEHATKQDSPAALAGKRMWSGVLKMMRWILGGK